METKPHYLWKIGRSLIVMSLVSIVIFVIAIESLGAHEKPWVSTIGYLIGFLLVAGGIIAWAFAIRFYALFHQEFGVMRSAVYLAILICLNAVSPFIFIAIEGRNRFFGLPPQ